MEYWLSEADEWKQCVLAVAFTLTSTFALARIPGTVRKRRIASLRQAIADVERHRAVLGGRTSLPI
jgi:hypothetical protein